MVQSPNGAKPLKDMADKLDRWADEQPKLPKRHGLLLHFSGSLKGALGNLPDLVFMYLRDFRPDQYDPIKSDYDKLICLAKDVDEERRKTRTDPTIQKMSAQAAAKKLAQKLRYIYDTAESYQQQTKITRVIPQPEKPDRKKAKPATKQAGRKGNERRFKPWSNSVDACFIIEDNRIKFHFKDKIKDLRLRNESRTHKLLFLLSSGSVSSKNVKTDLCTGKTKPYNVVRDANKTLNRKIAELDFGDVPQDVEFIEYDRTSNDYRCRLKIHQRQDFDRLQM